MMRIAHLTDLHLLEERLADRSIGSRARLAFLSAGRKLEPRERRVRAARALALARAAAPSHLVLTGDLTEDGSLPQFEVLAELLAESGIPPSQITIVPGNHDFYAHRRTWARALAGPLRAYAPTSTAPLTLAGATLVPVSTGFHQCCAWSGGAMGTKELLRLTRLARDPAFARRPLLLVQHHPPHGHAWTLAQWVDGLRERAAVLALLRAHRHLYVVHGHTHAAIDKPVEPGGTARVFSGEAVVNGTSPLRVYEVADDRLVPEPARQDP